MEPLKGPETACACLYAPNCQKAKMCLNGKVGWLRDGNNMAYVNPEFFNPPEGPDQRILNSGVILHG